MINLQNPSEMGGSFLFFMETIKLLFALIAIAGYIANIKDRKELSYWLWIFSNAGWGILAAIQYEWALAIMFLVYEGFCLYGVIRIISNKN